MRKYIKSDLFRYRIVCLHLMFKSLRFWSQCPWLGAGDIYSGPLHKSVSAHFPALYKVKRLILNLFSCHRSLWKSDKSSSSESE